MGGHQVPVNCPAGAGSSGPCCLAGHQVPVASRGGGGGGGGGSQSSPYGRSVLLVPYVGDHIKLWGPQFQLTLPVHNSGEGSTN